MYMFLNAYSYLSNLEYCRNRLSSQLDRIQDSIIARIAGDQVNQTEDLYHNIIRERI